MRLIWTPELEDWIARPLPVRTRVSSTTWVCILIAHALAALAVAAVARWWGP